jgi:hypothetical protein
MMQQLRDELYPNTEHVVDKDSAIYPIVSA